MRIDPRSRAFQCLDVCTGNLDAARKALHDIGAHALAKQADEALLFVFRLRDIVAEAYPSEASERLARALRRMGVELPSSAK